MMAMGLKGWNGEKGKKEGRDKIRESRPVRTPLSKTERGERRDLGDYPVYNPEEDEYDPCKPENIAPVTQQESELLTSQVVVQQINKLESALRNSAPNRLPVVSGHYNRVI